MYRLLSFLLTATDNTLANVTGNGAPKAWRDICIYRAKGMFLDNIFETFISDIFENDIDAIACHPVLTQYIDKSLDVR